MEKKDWREKDEQRREIDVDIRLFFPSFNVEESQGEEKL